jgi:competence protein ComEA
MGGYFTGRRGAVNIVTIDSQQNENQYIASAIDTPGAAISETSKPGGASNASTAGVGASGGGEAPGSNTGDTETTVQPEEVPEIAGAPKGGDGKININLASHSELMDLPGIGSVIASRIVDYRRQYGAFNRIEDLRKVSGIGEKKYEAIQDKITVG